VPDAPEEANMITSNPQRSMAINISKINRNLDTLEEHPENSQSKSMPASPTFHEGMYLLPLDIIYFTLFLFTYKASEARSKIHLRLSKF
jgi:hypothetical protein